MKSPRTSSGGVPWARIVGELLVIVAGILIALAADAWWNERAERLEERAALRELRAEFEDNAIQLDSVVAHHRTGLEAATTLVGFLRGEEVLGADSVAVLVRELDQAWTYNPKSGAIEALIASGRLDIIQDDVLRVALAGWSGLVEDYREDEGAAKDYVATAQFDYLQGVLNWGTIYRGESMTPSAALLDLRGDAALESLVAYRISWFDVILDESVALVQALQRIRTRLDSILGGPEDATP